MRMKAILTQTVTKVRLLSGIFFCLPGKSFVITINTSIIEEVFCLVSKCASLMNLK